MGNKKPKKENKPHYIVIGTLLLSNIWWIDILIKLPLSYAFGLLIGIYNSGLFVPGMIIFYWFLQSIGLYIFLKGVRSYKNIRKNKMTTFEMIKDIFNLSTNFGIYPVIYTAIIVILAIFGILKYPF